MSDFFAFPGENPSPFHYLEADEAIRYEDEKFTECRAVKLFYVIYGRNAWNDTWITRYFDGCMNPTFDTAKKTSEEKRVQGSVFYISEIPALQFISDSFSIIVTEINSDQPLQYCQEYPDGTILTTKSIYDYFEPLKKNSIIRLVWKKRRIKRTAEGLKKISHDLRGLEALAKRSTFKKYKSFSHGKEYLLGWSEMAHNMSQSAVVRLAAQFDRLIVSHKYAEYRSVCDETLEKLKIPVKELKLSDATLKRISNASIRFVGDLVQFTESRLQDAISDETCVTEVRDVLIEKELSLKPEKAVVDCDYRDKSVEELELSVRTANCLKNANIITVGQLIEMTEADLLRTQNFGRKSLNELKNVLSDIGLSLAKI